MGDAGDALPTWSDVLLPEVHAVTRIWLALRSRSEKKFKKSGGGGGRGSRGRGWFHPNVLSKGQLFPGRRGHLVSDLVMTYTYVEHWCYGHLGMVLTNITLHLQQLQHSTEKQSAQNGLAGTL